MKIALAIAALFVLAGCAPLNPTLGITGAQFTLSCDGNFDGLVTVTATYAPPPGVPLPRLAPATFTNPAVQTANTNLSDVKFEGLPLSFTANSSKTFKVTGRLTVPCDLGTLGQLKGDATAASGLPVTVQAGGPFNVGAVPMIGRGPTPDPTASGPGRTFSFDDTLHCCGAGNATLTPRAGVNVGHLTASKAMIACAPGPTPNETVGLKGNLLMPEGDGKVFLDIAANGKTCPIYTNVRQP